MYNSKKSPRVTIIFHRNDNFDIVFKLPYIKKTKL